MRLGVGVVLAALCGCGATTIVDGGEGGTAQTRPNLEVSLTTLDAVFCYCLHGCGPGMSGYVAFDVHNPSSAPVEVLVARLELAESGGASYVLLAHPHPFNNGSEESLGPDETTSFDFPIQHDVSELAPGSYELTVVLRVGGEEQATSVGTHVIDEDGQACF